MLCGVALVAIELVAHRWRLHDLAGRTTGSIRNYTKVNKTFEVRQKVRRIFLKDDKIYTPGAEPKPLPRSFF